MSASQASARNAVDQEKDFLTSSSVLLQTRSLTANRHFPPICIRATMADKKEEQLQFKQMTQDDLKRVHALEAASYPEDEAASLESLTYRTKNANQYFLI